MTERDIAILVCTESAAMYLDMTGHRLRYLASSGRIPHERTGSTLRFDVFVLDQWRTENVPS